MKQNYTQESTKTTQYKTTGLGTKLGLNSKAKYKKQLSELLSIKPRLGIENPRLSKNIKPLGKHNTTRNQLG